MNQLLCEYADKSIFTIRSVYLNYKGYLYVSMGTVDNQRLSDRLDTCLIDDSEIFVLIDTVPGYGKLDTSTEYNVGDITLINAYDLHNGECALKRSGNKMRKLCECGCMGDKEPNEIYGYEWFHITSDDELVEKSIWLSEI